MSDLRSHGLTHPVPVLMLVAVLSVVAALGAVAMYAYSVLALEPPLSYPDLPNPIEAPGEPNVPLPVDARPKLHAGDTVVTLPYRCVTDDGGSGLGTLPYTFTRSLYNASTGQRVLDMPGGQNTADVGCHRVRSTIHTIPPETPPGVYYIGGTVTAAGARHAATVPWRTADFEVVPR